MATYITNKRNTANITHIFWYDASVPAFSPNLMHAALPYNLLPVVPAVGDIVYFGINTAWVDSGPFCSLVFDIGTAQTDITGIDWEYWTAPWGGLTVQDNTNADGAMTGVAFDTAGVNSVHWKQQPGWFTTTVNGITGYWVRAIVTGIGAAPSPPTQQNRDVYSIVWPYAEIQAAAIGGDIPALARVMVENQSSYGANLYAQQVTAGLRSMSRGENFTAYINLCNEQNPDGLTVTAVGSTTFVVDADAPTGVSAHYNPVGVEAMGDEIDIVFSDALAPHFYGQFRAYLRGDRNGGAAGDFSAQLEIAFGTPYLTDVVTSNHTAADYAVLDMGKIDLGPTGSLAAGDDTFSSSITVRLANSNAAPGDFFLYDLILIPVDEWAAGCSYTDPVRYLERTRYLDIDAVGHPKNTHRCFIRNVSGDAIRTNWIANAPGPPMLQANARQRLWFFHQFLDTGYWHADIEIADTIKIYANQQYLTMRGTR